MPLLEKVSVLAAKIETTSGTAESLTAAEAAFNAYDVVFRQGSTVSKREGQGGFGGLTSIIEGYQASIDFKIDAAWDGTSTEPAWADLFLPGCGWVKSGGNQYYPKSEAPGSNVKTLTIGHYVNGTRQLLSGAAGTFRLVCPAGKAAYFEFSFTGIWSGSKTDTAILAPTYPTALPLRFASSTTTYNSVALVVENLTLDSGNTVVLREGTSSASGFTSGIISDRKVMVTGNPEAELTATQDRYGIFVASGEYTLTWDLDGPTNSKITVAAPKAQIESITPGGRNGVQTDEITWSCNRNGSTIDQEASILFTPAS